MSLRQSIHLVVVRMQERASALADRMRGVAVSRDELARLRLAQHWARGGLLSQPGEPWSPACLALALAALAHDELGALELLVSAAALRASGEPQLANIFAQAYGELGAAAAASGAQVPNSRDWPKAALAARARELLEQASAAARAAIAERARGNLHAGDGSSYVGQTTPHDPLAS